MYALDLGGWNAQFGERPDMGPLMPGTAHHPDPPDVAGEHVTEHGTQFRAMVVGDDHVGCPVEAARRTGDDRNPHLLRIGARSGLIPDARTGESARVGLQQQPAETEIRGIAQQETSHRGGEDGDERTVGVLAAGRTVRHRAPAVLAFVCGHPASLAPVDRPGSRRPGYAGSPDSAPRSRRATAAMMRIAATRTADPA